MNVMGMAYGATRVVARTLPIRWCRPVRLALRQIAANRFFGYFGSASRRSAHLNLLGFMELFDPLAGNVVGTVVIGQRFQTSADSKKILGKSSSFNSPMEGFTLSPGGALSAALRSFPFPC